MKAFQFPLAKVLEWRRIQLDLEESRYKQQAMELAGIDRKRAEWEAAAIRAELEVREWTPLAGGDLAALGRFRLHVQDQERSLTARRAACQAGLEARQRTMLEARRRYRLLERLQERRLAEWRLASDREIEQLAAESHLAGLVRERY